METCREDIEGGHVLRLTLVAETDTTATLKAEGAIVAEWGALLEAECLKCLARKRELVLDFSGVRLVDKRSADMLKNIMRGRDVKVINCWGLIEAQIRNGAEGSKV